MKKFSILRKEMVLENEWMPIEKQRVILPNGEEADWFLHRGPSAVLLLPFLESGEILLQRSYKHGAGREIIEFCAGIIEKGEEPFLAAKRELLEETGCEAKELVFLGEYFANPTGSPCTYSVFLARGCKKVSELRLDPAEQIENFSVKSQKELFRILSDPLNSTSLAALGAYALIQSEYFKPSLQDTH